MYHGIINVYKEPGYTSFDVVAKLRGILGQKKIGHTGTLDPDAEGVLPVCLGKATKVCDLLTDRDKEYRAVMHLGIETDTLDMSGNILSKHTTEELSDEDIQKAVFSFVGEVEQIPPMYSALKVNGKKLCDLARKGQTVERQPRRITIYSIEIMRIELPCVEMIIRCSKGTYIRTLCDDIGKKLGCGAVLEHLIRTVAAGYHIEDAHRLDEIEQIQQAGGIDAILRPVEDVFSSYPLMQVKSDADRLLYNGNALYKENFENYIESKADAPVRVRDSQGTFCAVYRLSDESDTYRPLKMFLG